MPRNRVLLETDGPFAQLRRAPLQPWDIALACVSMSRLWGIEPAETNQVIRDNENSLLGGDQQAGD